MSEIFYPRHIQGNVRDATSAFPTQADRHHFFYSVVCDCGNSLFDVWISEKRTVKAVCRICKKEVLICDRSQYPASRKRPGAETFALARHPLGGDLYGVYVMYEYGEFDEDQSFDRNDITWCQVFLENQNGDIAMILDDETA